MIWWMRSIRAVMMAAAVFGGGLVCAAPEPIPFKNGATEEALPPGATLLLAVLVAALAASLVFAWYRRRPKRARGAGGGMLRGLLARPTASARAIQVLDSARLDVRTSLYTVQWRDRELLVACSDHGVALLASDTADEAQS
jgi:flagellar biogenesis protein FliO